VIRRSCKERIVLLARFEKPPREDTRVWGLLADRATSYTSRWVYLRVSYEKYQIAGLGFLPPASSPCQEPVISSRGWTGIISLRGGTIEDKVPRFLRKPRKRKRKILQKRPANPEQVFSVFTWLGFICWVSGAARGLCNWEAELQRNINPAPANIFRGTKERRNTSYSRSGSNSTKKKLQHNA
jgi:hypothetical protein